MTSDHREPLSALVGDHRLNSSYWCSSKARLPVEQPTISESSLSSDRSPASTENEAKESAQKECKISKNSSSSKKCKLKIQEPSSKKAANQTSFHAKGRQKVNEMQDKKSRPKAKKRRETQTKLGFAGHLPSDLTMEIRIPAIFKRQSKFGVIVSKSLLVVKIDEDSFLQGKLRLCDFVVKIGDKDILSKAEFYVQMRNMRRSEEEFTLTVQRPRWNRVAEYLPDGYDRVPGYSYIKALLLQYPGAALGMNIKSYNSKVYITHTEQLSIAVQSCLMGDCIVAVEGTPVTTVACCNALIISYLSIKKFTVLTLERPVDDQAVQVVRCALLAEKKPEIDARMAVDTTEIGLQEAENVRQKRYIRQLRSIYRRRQRRSSDKRHVQMADLSLYTPITCDPYNPILMKAVPPKKMDVFYANLGKRDIPSTPNINSSNPLLQITQPTDSSHKM